MPNSLAHNLLRSGGRRTTLFLVACILYFAGRAPFFGQWDSFDYVKQIVTHQLSNLGFGRPVFIGYNILLWESARHIFRLSRLDAEWVILSATILTGAIGVVLFGRFARGLLPALPAQMAMLAFLLSPIYALYSGFIMTEVPMMVAALAAGVILWVTDARYRAEGALAAGVIFGMAVGIREQAVTFGAAYLWILWVRRPDTRRRLEGGMLFGLSALAVIVAPILGLFIHDPQRFFERITTWLRAIPMSEGHFWRNFEASLLFTLALCPGAWLTLLGGGLFRLFRHAGTEACDSRRGVTAIVQQSTGSLGLHIPHPYWGILCGIVLPVAALWRDADVQIHPRYALVALPGALILCASLYARWFPTKKAAVTWAALQVLFFGIAQIGIQPFRQIQRQKKEYAELVLRSIPDRGLLIAGSYSPVLDYYRGIGARPQWQLLWSGWGWERKTAEATIRDAWRSGPVYLCNGPYGWLYLENEWLDLYFFFRDCRKEVVAPGIARIFPP